MSDFGQFNEPVLPPVDSWKEALNDGQSETEYSHAMKVFESFAWNNFGDNHVLYLATDVLPLACVFEEFRRICYKAYGLDCCFHYSASNLSGEAFLKICKADIELLTNAKHLEIAENLLRGGVSSIYQKRFENAYN